MAATLRRAVRLTLPPYARQGPWRNDLAVRIYAGPYAWKRAARHVNSPFDSRYNVLALPPDADPRQYRWPVGNRSVLILDTGAEQRQVERLILAVHEYGAALIAVAWSDGKGEILCCREARNAS